MKTKQDRVAHKKPSDFSLGQLYEFCAEFGRQGGSPELMQKLIENKKKLSETVAFAKKITKSQEWWMPRVILGVDFISPEEMEHIFSFKYSENELKQIRGTLPSEELIRHCYFNDYMLIAGPSDNLNLLQIQKIVQGKISISENDPPWFVKTNERFAKQQVVRHCRWLAIKKHAHSFGRTFEEQKEACPKDDVIPNVAEICYAFIAYHCLRGIRLLNDHYVRTSSISDVDQRGVIAGYQHKNIFCVDRAWQGGTRQNIGILSANLMF